jgi:hypothetical protein
MRKKMKKRVKKLQSLQDCQFPCKIVVDRVDLLARLLLSERIFERRIFGQVSVPVATYVSLLVNGVRGTEQQCTVGGLVRVGSQIFGLTVAHAFLPGSATTIESAVESSEEFSDSEGDADTDTDTGAETDTDESLFHELNSDRLSMLTRRSTISEEISRTATNESDTTQSVEIASRTKALGHVPKTSCFGNLYATSAENEQNLDWALIEISHDASNSPNTFFDPTAGKAAPIQYDAHSDNTQGDEVYVLAGKSGTQTGSLGQSNVQILLGGRKFLVTQIIMHSSLGKVTCLSS